MASTLSGRPGGPGPDPGPAEDSRSRPRRWHLPALARGARAGDGRGQGAGPAHRHRWKAMLFALTAVLIVGVMAWALLGSTLLVVRSVRVTGNGRAVSAAQVVAAAGIAHGQPLIWVDTGAIARRVARLRQVQSASVSKDWPTTLVITVRLRTPVFSMAVHGGYALVDAFGVNLAEVSKRPRGLPVLTAHTASGTLRDSPAVRAAAAVLAELPGRVYRQVRGVTTGGPNDVSVTLAGGAVVVWGGTERGAVKAKELTILMQRHARVYDVSGVGTAVTRG